MNKATEILRLVESDDWKNNPDIVDEPTKKVQKYSPKVILDLYHEFEEANYHLENYILLAKFFNKPAKLIKELEEIMRIRDKGDGISQKQSDYAYKQTKGLYQKLVKMAK